MPNSSRTSTAGAIPYLMMSSGNANSYIAFATTPTNNTSATERVRIDKDGNVGIGDSNPGARLEITPSGTDAVYINNSGGTLKYDFGFDGGGDSQYRMRDTSGNVDILFSTNGGTASYINAGNVGIGTTSPTTRLYVGGVAAAAPSGTSDTGGLTLQTTNGSKLTIGNCGVSPYGSWLQSGHTTNTSQIYPLVFNPLGGNVGVASTSPWRTLSVTGTVGFDGLTGSTGAGSLCLDSNKQVVYNSASDNCLSSTSSTKHEITPLSLDDLDLVTKLQPVSFIYNGSEQARYGFIAEDTANVDAHLATYDANGIVSGIDDRSILAVVIGAIKDLYAQVQEYFARTERLENELDALKARLSELEAAAGTSLEGPEAPGGSSTPSQEGADTVSTTTPSATTTPPSEDIANDPVSADEVSDDEETEDDQRDPDTQPEVSQPAQASPPLAESTDDNDPPQSPVPTTANDNQPSEELRATGTQ